MRNLTILFFLLLCLTAKAQTVEYCHYSFDTEAIPEDFKTYDIDGQTLHFSAIQQGFSQGDAWIGMREENVYPYNYFAASTSHHKKISGQDVQPANDWMLTPAVYVRAKDAVLTWRSNSICENGDMPSTYSVLVFTEAALENFKSALENFSADVENFKSAIVETVSEDSINGWTEHSVSLAQFAGEQVYIAFVNTTLDGELLAIDDIIAKGGLGTYSFTTSAVPYVCGVNTFTPTLTFTQESEKPITSFTAYLLNLSTNEETTKKVDGLNLQKGENVEVPFGHTYDVAYGDTLRFRIWLTVEGVDSDPIETQTVFLSFKPEQHIVIEEGTGAWCGWCPQGIVAMRRLKKTYGDTIVPISVHYNDVMEVDGYVSENGITFPLGFPSGEINRRYATTPLKEVHVDRQSVWTTLEGGFETYVLKELDELPMAEVQLTATVENKLINIASTTTFCLPQSKVNLRMAYILTEDTWSSKKVAQSNYISGASYDMDGFESLPQTIVGFEFEDVARGAASNAFQGIANSIQKNIDVDVPYTHETSMAIPSTVTDINNCHLVAMLIDSNSGRIVNSQRIALGCQEGIEAVPFVSQNSSKMYDLQGRPIYSQPSSGFYIVNGKKVLR